MTIQEMHYDFKKKFNKIDSQKNRNLLVPEIDWTLNEAEEIFIKCIAEPRFKSYLGFETSQRTIDDISSIVVPGLDIIPTVGEDTGGYILLPDNYRHFVKGTANLTKGACTSKARVYVRQHDDMFEESPFDRSSFEWRTVNVVFDEIGLKTFTDNTFIINDVRITYIRKTKYMHFASGFRAGGYNSPSGVPLIGTENCELPEGTHREIVDIAVLLASGEVQASDYQLKLAKLKLNQFT